MSIESLTTQERILEPYHHIDAGFINLRLCLNTFGEEISRHYERVRLQAGDHWSNLQNDHILVELVLRMCKEMGVPTLSSLVNEGLSVGRLWCSTESLEGVGVDAIYGTGRVRNQILLPFLTDDKHVLDFGTNHFVADTGRTEQQTRHMVSIIAGVHDISDGVVVSRPIIMGAPSYNHPHNRNLEMDLIWSGFDHYEILPEDIEAFSLMKQVAATENEWISVMRELKEPDVKRYLSEILGDVESKDWGGEQADHITSTIAVGGKRLHTALLLKGPAGGKLFKDMSPTHLGKNGDQIYRMAQTTANLLIVQHCNSIGEAVRAQLRAFAVQPSNPRRYCLIDGKSTFRILRAYGKI